MEQADKDKIDRKRNKLRKRKRMVSWNIYEDRYCENIYFDSEQENFFDKGDDYAD